LSTLLTRALRPIPADFQEPPGANLNHVYLILHAVQDLEPGGYVYHPPSQVLERIKTGDFRAEAGQLALGQDLAADASLNIYFLIDLDPILKRFGNRGYRVAQLEAALFAGRLYLAAYAVGIGATGLTFYDDAVTRFFSPHAQGKQVMFLIALGKKAGL
jgi:SagB-type dehydrogenase family enzyme